MITKPFRKLLIIVYKRLRWSRSSYLCIIQRSNLHIRWSSLLRISRCIRLRIILRSHLHMSQSLRLSMIGHLCLNYHLTIILTLHLLSWCLNFVNNHNTRLINKIFSLCINFVSFAMHIAGCACMLNRPSPVRTGRGHPRSHLPSCRTSLQLCQSA